MQVAYARPARMAASQVTRHRYNTGQALGRRHLKARGLPSISPAVAHATEGLVFSVGEPGSWDEGGVANPTVRCYIGDNEERWYMWYTGRRHLSTPIDSLSPSAGNIGLAVSKDGITWLRGTGAVAGARGAASLTDVGMVLTPNEDWWTLDTNHLAVSDVQVLSNSSVDSGVGVYWMFYTGGDYEPVRVPAGVPGLPEGGEVEGIRMRPGLAMSQDGRNWARIEGEHHTGALFDAGEAGEWDSLFVGAPQVVMAGPRDMRLYYHSYDTAKKRFGVGLATSPDGFRWTKKGPIFAGGSAAGDHDELGITARHVVRDPETKQFVMFYEGVASNGISSIGLATSKDGISNWQRLEKPLLEGSADNQAWDHAGVGCPCAVQMAGGRWRLYYTGRQRKVTGPWEGVGLALSIADGPSFNGVQCGFKRRTGKAALSPA